MLAFNCWQSWRNGHKATKIAEAVTEIKAQTDGLTKQLVKTTGDAKFAAGVKKGEENAIKNGT